MTLKTARKEFEKYIRLAGTPVERLTPKLGIRLMLDFYRDVRADGCAMDEDGDMLLFQWGTYGFDGPPTFQFDVTRQLTEAETEEQDEEMSQLSLTFHFPPSAQLEALKDGNRWCRRPGELEEFAAFISRTEANGAIATARCEKVTLKYGEV